MNLHYENEAEVNVETRSLTSSRLQEKTSNPYLIREIPQNAFVKARSK